MAELLLPLLAVLALTESSSTGSRSVERQVGVLVGEQGARAPRSSPRREAQAVLKDEGLAHRPLSVATFRAGRGRSRRADSRIAHQAGAHGCGKRPHCAGRGHALARALNQGLPGSGVRLASPGFPAQGASMQTRASLDVVVPFIHHRVLTPPAPRARS